MIHAGPLAHPRAPRLLAAGGAIAILLAPARALPCQPPPSGLDTSVPADGAVYPGNGILLLSGQELSLDGIEATIDGQKASLLPVKLPHLHGFAPIEATLQPQPAAGQSVVLSGTFCAPGVECPATSVHFTASAPDVTAPPPPVAIEVDAYDFADFRSSGGDCQSDADLSYWVHLRGAPAAAGDAPVLYDVAALRAPGLDEVVASRKVLVRGDPTVVRFDLLAADLGGASIANALCFRVTTIDAAGNLSLSLVDACTPCRARVDAPGASPAIPDEPAWTDADRVPGGACVADLHDAGAGGAPAAGGAGGATSGHGGAGGAPSTGAAVSPSIGHEGCACEAQGAPSAGASARAGAIALAAALLARRRRRGAIAAR